MRVNVNISENTKKWFENKSNETGISQSALMAMALSEYIDQKESINGISDMIAYFQDLEKKYVAKNES